MRRLLLTASFASAVTAVGCTKNPDGLPPATQWQTEGVTGTADQPAMPPAIGMGAAGGNPDDPHAGINMGEGGDDPHAGLDMSGGDPSDPHAGLDMTQNPHGTGGGVDVTKLGLAGPDPNRPIDPTHRIAGLVVVDPKLKAQAKPGGAIFLVVKRVGANGAQVGSALAVDKLTWSSEGVPFELTDAQAMIAGTDLTGDVIVTARYDQDSDAISKQPGDLSGQVRVKIPANQVKLTLDTAL